MEIMLITGMSGSGKSVALHALEDAGFYCVDNLPPELLQSLITLERQHGAQRIAIAMDVRSANSLPLLPQQLSELAQSGASIKPVFLDAATDTLVRRYSESRRRHPLSQASSIDQQMALVQAIEWERELLSDIRAQAHVIDTSFIRAAHLQRLVKDLVTAPASALTLVFQSFAFKRGIPFDADFVFDVRMLPNPHYEAGLRMLTGKDAPVIDYLQAQPLVQNMRQQIADFLRHWLHAMVRDHRSYVTVAIGCTGGQHRSVYLTEVLAQEFSAEWVTLKRHRELDGH